MMKRTLMALVAIMASTHASADDFDSIRGDTTRENQVNRARVSTVDMVETEVAKNIKQKCDYQNGCSLFVDDGSGNEFRISVGAGEGPSYGANGGGINIYNGYSNETYYGITLTYTHSNFKCVRRVNEATFKLIETYQRLMSSREYVERVFNAWKRGEDLATPEAVKTALSVLATIKPGQGNCGQSDYRR